jgi:hypothetical protein
MSIANGKFKHVLSRPRVEISVRTLSGIVHVDRRSARIFMLFHSSESSDTGKV